MPDRQADHVGLDLFERAQVAVVGVELDADPVVAECFGVLFELADQFEQLRKVFPGERVAVAEHRGAEQHRLELPDVARPVVGAEQFERPVGNPERPQTGLLADLAEEIAGERGDVAGPFAQRRQHDARRGERAVEIAAELAGLDQFAQRTVAGRDHAQVDAERMARADRADRARGDRFGEPFLQRLGQPVDLVEHQGAAVAMLQRPDLAVERARKRAFLMPEQHRFDRIGRYAADVDDADRGLRARARRVHRADQHFLAGAGLALDQHEAVAAGRLGRLGERGAERGRGADHRIEIERGRHLLGQRLELVLGRLARGRAAQRLHQPVGRDGLDQVVGRPGAHRLDREQRACAGGQHQDRQRRAPALQLGDQRAGVVARDPLVEHDRRELHALAGAERGDRGLRILDHQRAPAFAAGERGDQPALRRLIVDQHQQTRFRLRHRPPNVPLWYGPRITRRG